MNQETANYIMQRIGFIQTNIEMGGQYDFLWNR